MKKKKELMKNDGANSKKELTLILQLVWILQNEFLFYQRYLSVRPQFQLLIYGSSPLFNRFLDRCRNVVRSQIFQQVVVYKRRSLRLLSLDLSNTRGGSTKSEMIDMKTCIIFFKGDSLVTELGTFEGDLFDDDKMIPSFLQNL